MSRSHQSRLFPELETNDHRAGGDSEDGVGLRRGSVSREQIPDMITWTYRVEDDVAGILVGQVDYECEEGEDDPYHNGFDDDPQDGLRVNEVGAILTRPHKGAYLETRSLVDVTVCSPYEEGDQSWIGIRRLRLK